jgi:hypothetical protein
MIGPTVDGFGASIVLNLEIAEIHPDPFPHVVKENFLAPELYDELRQSFPDCPPNSGPTGYSYFWGDPEYERLLASSPAWKALFEATQSQSMIDYCVRQFRGVCEANDCTVDLDKASYVSYCESRADKERRHLSKVEHEPHKLWVRTDILQGRTGYNRRSHLDHRRRLLALLIYFCNFEENEMEGGELVLHAEHMKRNPARDVVIKPQHNRLVAFACSNNSYHSVPMITSQKAPRNFIQVGVSSSVDAWPDNTPFLTSLKSAIGARLFSGRRVASAGN